MTWISVADNARTTLATGIDDNDLTIVLTAGASFPAANFVLTICKSDRTDLEKILIDSRSTNTLTVNASGRAYGGTSAAAHTAGDLCYLGALKEVVAEIEAAVDLNTAKVTNANHSGDATGATALTIAAGAVTYSKMQDVSATDKVLGRSTAGAGDVEEIACTAAGRAILDDANAAAQLVTLGAVSEQQAILASQVFS
jgi:hypothetical protein